ncbi:MAG TPA: TraR/DksA family transcriptional regulator [bacterium]|nr:TraR/DksA family transcriptional regulator [bacterium]
MNQREKARYKKLLLDKRMELLNQMAFIKDVEMESTNRESSGDHSAYAFHMADQGTDTMQREKNFFYAQRDGRLLYHIDQALERLDEGVYGLCHSCQQPINKERLEAVPHARLCIQCKSREEELKINEDQKEEDGH